MDELARLDGVGQAELVANGTVKPTELIEAAITRIEKLNPVLNAMVIDHFEEARALAESPDLPAGPFRGVPVMLKDSVPSAGHARHWGMRAMKEAGWVDRTDAHVVAQIKRSGCIIVGRTNTPEFEASISTEPLIYGPTCNPWNTEYSAAGSSGGSGAAVAAGLVPMALGIDGGGSGRIPASVAGVVALKPTRGRTSLLPSYGANQPWITATATMLTRTVRDTAASLDHHSGAPTGADYVVAPPARPFLEEVGADPGRLRIGLWSPVPSLPNVDPDCIAAVEATGRLLEGLGHTVELSHPRMLDGGTHPAFFTVSAGFIAAAIEDIEAELGRPISESDMEPETWQMYQATKGMHATQLTQAAAQLRIASIEFASWWDSGYDVLVTPTIAVTPFKNGVLKEMPAEAMHTIVQWIPFTSQFNMSGLPAITLPLATSADGLPVGVQLGAAHGEEAVLIRLAAQLEQAAPWRDRTPPIHA